MIKNPKFLYIFSELGEDWILREDIMRSLEEFVCLLHGRRRVKRSMIYGTSSSKILTSKRIKSLIYLLLVNRLLDCTLFDVTLWPKSGKTQTYVLYRNPQLLIMVGLGNVRFSRLKRLFQTILSNCCQRAVMTRILKKQIQKALTTVTLSLEEQTLKYNREVV